jgi:4,5:9,10-diseco-3-hydroxy-5,9,17-trioxoandrosta-1(10),2-diene-4-oate hydrolase
VELSFVDLGGVEVAVRAAGHGDPLVCLHAVGQGARDFDQLAERLADRFRIIAPDWPGHGDSSDGQVPPEAAAYAALLPALLGRLEIDRALVLGNSIGGAAAIRLASSHPERVRGLVLVDSGGLVPLNLVTRFAIRRQAARFARGAAGDPAFPTWYEHYYAQLLREPAADWRRREIVAEGFRMAPLLAKAWEGFAEPEGDIRSLVPQLTVPLLYAWGRRDPAIPWWLARSAGQSAREYSVALFDCGHCAFLERPEEFDAALLAYAADLA